MIAMAELTLKQHIFIDENRVARIGESQMRVSQLIQAHLAHGYSPFELTYQFTALSLAEVYAALAFYHDNQAIIDAEIEEIEREVALWRSEDAEAQAQFTEKLRELGHLT